MFILSFSISFVCLVVTPLILCIIPLWESATAHSPSGKELNPSSQEDTRFSGRCTSTAIYNILFYVWSISIVKDRRFVEKCSLRLWWSFLSILWVKH